MAALPFCHVTLRAAKPLAHGYPRVLETLGDHLRRRRLDLGLRQRDVAEQLAVAIATLKNWERNRATPTGRLTARVLAFLGYSP